MKKFFETIQSEKKKFVKAKIKKVAETPTIEIFEREMTPLKSFVYLIPPNKFKIPHKPFIPAPSEGLSKEF